MSIISKIVYRSKSQIGLFIVAQSKFYTNEIA
jgi:hypothetical protein